MLQELINLYISKIFLPDIWKQVININEIEPKNFYDFESSDDNAPLNILDTPNEKHRRGESEESEAHKKLKQYVIDNCENIDILKMYGCNKDGAESEYIFLTNDRADIIFHTSPYKIACEVKSYISDEADHERGLYQCIKYSALMNAKNIIDSIEPSSISILIVQKELPTKLQKVALRLKIPYVILTKDIVKN